MNRKWKMAVRSLGCLVAFVAVGCVIFVWIVLPRMTPEEAGINLFFHDNAFTLNKAAPDGSPYTVNNSTASFHLDIAKKKDVHQGIVFKTYADALRHCREHGLPVLPSSQLIQGRLKAFDDPFCATLEMAMHVSQRAALENLLDRLLHTNAPAAAITYVATALSLCGVEPKGLNDERMQQVRASESLFKDTADATPCGFWDSRDELKRLFRSDRYLTQGINLHKEPDACISLGNAIVGDTDLSATFATLRAFGAALCNPSAATVSAETVAVLSPQQILQQFPSDARLAVIAYSSSPEERLVQRLMRKRVLNGDENIMGLIIDAVRDGRLQLAPKPDSGWYDYQWYALETLLVPERGHESAKLTLTPAYRLHLENAFAATLAKTRETHIKRLPILTIGSELEYEDSDTDGDTIKVSPDFSTEPIPTVYRRWGRAYRFLQNKMCTLFADEWPHLRLHDSGRPLSEALRETALFCYGLYETLCLEIGQYPQYLDGELSTSERGEARAIFDRWHETWRNDPALTNDTRIAAPVAYRPGQQIVHWGTAGVVLKAAVFTYRDLPMVTGKNAEYVPQAVYLPSDLFVEFTPPSLTPLTRTEFSEICDRHRDPESLKRALAGAQTVSLQLGISNAFKRYWGVLLAAIAAGLYATIKRSRRWIAWALAAAITGWLFLIVISPQYRTSFIVRRLARINVPLALICELRLLPSIPQAPRLKALSQLCVHPDPNVRYLALRSLLGANTFPVFKDSPSWQQPGIRENIRQAALDPDPEIAVLALAALENVPDRSVTDFLIDVLPRIRHSDILCGQTIRVLAETKDPRAFTAIQPFCEDPRPGISGGAIHALGRLGSFEAQDHLWHLAQSPIPTVRSPALLSIQSNCKTWWSPQMDSAASEQHLDRLLMERIMSEECAFDIRMRMARFLSNDQSLQRAHAVLWEAAGSHAQSNNVLKSVVLQHVPRLHERRRWDVPLNRLINQPDVQRELAHAVSSQNPVVVTQALLSVMSQAEKHPSPEISAIGTIMRDGLARPSMRRRRRR